jgi:ankyrin repeat protein
MSPATQVVKAIQEGDTESLSQVLTANPDLPNVRIDGQRTLLHIATDWPGHFPNVAATIVALVAQGADVNAAFIGRHSETPLHWAASSDDVAALRALLDHGANLEAGGGVIGGGTPMADAVAFGQWKSARILLERGAQTNLWQAAALGLMDRVEQHFTAAPKPHEITNAFWCACHGGQMQTAEYLLTLGAELNWIGYDRLTAQDAATRHGNLELVEWLRQQGAKTAVELH